jgi:prepilin-type N-terminal cleavage/methylation domain-containing protein
MNALHKRTVRRGLTLIEVLAALAILSVLIGALLEIGLRSRSQLIRAEQLRSVIGASNMLLERWYEQGGPPLRDQGVLPIGRHTYVWRTRPTNTADDLLRIGVRQVRLEVLAADQKPLLSVELVRLALPEPRTSPAPPALEEGAR